MKRAASPAGALRLSRVVMRNTRQNLFFAFIYNAVGLPIAAGALYPVFGLLAQPDYRQRRNVVQLALGREQRASPESICDMNAKSTG